MSSKPESDIPQEWIMNYVDKLLSIAREMKLETPMRNDVMRRADYAMDLLSAFRESQKGK